MKLSKKQERLIYLIEKCNGIFIAELSQKFYPMSMVTALEKKGAVSIYKNKITSNLI
mgnify:CR=1 FL=1